MSSSRGSLSLIILTFVPDLALAHGEEVLLFPVGTLAAVVAIILSALAYLIHWHVRFLAGAMAVAASIPFWFVPGDFFPAALRYTSWGNFAVGFLPSLIAGGLVVWLLRRWRSEHSGV